MPIVFLVANGPRLPIVGQILTGRPRALRTHPASDLLRLLPDHAQRCQYRW
jgi:hypothetical protein